MLLYSSNADKIEVIVLKISELVMHISQRLIAHEGKEKHMLKRVKLDNKFRASTTSILKKFHSEHRVLSYFRDPWPNYSVNSEAQRLYVCLNE